MSIYYFAEDVSLCTANFCSKHRCRIRKWCGSLSSFTGGWLTFKQTFLSQCNQMHITASRCSSTTSALTACCPSPYYFNPEQASRKYKLPEVLEGKTLLFDNLSQLSLAEQECPAWSMQDSCILTSPKLYSIPPSHIMHICSLAQGTF